MADPKRDRAGKRYTAPMTFDLDLTIDAVDTDDLERTYEEVHKRMSIAMVMVYRALLRAGRVVDLALTSNGTEELPVREMLTKVNSTVPEVH